MLAIAGKYSDKPWRQKRSRLEGNRKPKDADILRIKGGEEQLNFLG